MDAIRSFFDEYISKIYIPKTFKISNVIEILILAFLIYEVLIWVKNTRARAVFKGIIVIVVVWVIAALFNFTTILWIGGKIFSIAVIALVIIFQPELRKALEQLGQKKYISRFFGDHKDKDVKFSDKTIDELIKASFDLGRARTGALIVIEQEVLMEDYIRTGIPVDAIVTSQLLINIFEHNTPLHDGAVILRGDRIVSATCYLPLSDNMRISKDLGTRHRAALGISEVSDSFTIVVSEETGKVSVAVGGELFRDVDSDYLRKKLTFLQKKTIIEKNKKALKGGKKNEK